MKTYFVGFDYGKGGFWYFVRAESAHSIRQEFPNIGIWETPPFFSKELLAEWKAEFTYNLDEIPVHAQRALKSATPNDLENLYFKARGL